MAHTSAQAEAGDAPWRSWSVWGSLFGPPRPERYSAPVCEPPRPSVPPGGGSTEDDEDEGRSFFAALDSAAEHFFGTDVFDGARWSRFLGDVGPGAKEISSLQPLSPEHIRMMATDPQEMLSRYQSVGLGLWDFTKGTGTFAYDASSLIPGSVAFVTEMHRTTTGGEHRGVRLVEQLGTATLPLASLAPGTPTFYSELGEAIRNRSIADHDGIQAAATMTVAIVNWETFTEDPSRWFGNILGEIGLEIATAGALSGAIGAAGAADNLARAAEDVAGAAEEAVAAAENAVRTTADDVGTVGSTADEASVLTNDVNLGNRSSRQTGAGASPDPADAAYDAIRDSAEDIDAIATNTGFPRRDISSIKDHLFFEEHYLDRYVDLGIPGEWRRFDSDSAIAAAWNRLESGRYHPEDIQLLRHELAELNYMRETGNPSYSTAHNYAESVHPAPKYTEME